MFRPIKKEAKKYSDLIKLLIIQDTYLVILFFKTPIKSIYLYPSKKNDPRNQNPY